MWTTKLLSSLLGLYCVSSLAQAQPPANRHLSDAPSLSPTYLCMWKGHPEAIPVDTAGGAERARYQRGPTYQSLNCAEYYVVVRTAYQEQLTQKRANPARYASMDPWSTWQCWYDDPCACELPRS
jgi:hypothetical protein